MTGTCRAADAIDSAGDIAPVLYDTYAQAFRAIRPDAVLAGWDDADEAMRTGWLAVAAVAAGMAQMAADMVPEALRAAGVTLTLEASDARHLR